MPQFVLEIGFEEMPARFVPLLMQELAEVLSKGLAEARLDCQELSTLATPRRLAVQVTGLAESQRREEQEVLGPPAKVAFDAAGAPTKAALGFAKGQGIAPEDLYRVTTDKGEYLAGRKVVGGGLARDILPGVCGAAIAALSFPKKMHWGAGEFTFGRPIRWILALLDDQVVEFEVGGTVSGRLSHGHRVMGPGPWSIATAGDYRQTVREQGRVVLNPQRRLEIIRTLGEASAGEVGGKVIWKDSLLAEVTNLVEHPIPLLGGFDPLYLELPREVLLTSMETHQKSFGVEDAHGKLMAHFLTVINLEPKGDDGEDIVRRGWERVLKARLEDARFFWREDLSRDFDQWLADLDAVIFIGGLGSIGDKARRLAKLCAALGETLQPELTLELSDAGLLAKCDLVTEMVGEFDTLQGIMGGIYARKKGKGEVVAQAIAEHYLPSGPDSPVPASIGGAILAMADKADTLAGCFGMEMIPTGAADPYALRRAALGICRIALHLGQEQALRLSLSALLDAATAGYQGVAWKLEPAAAKEKLLDFFGQRLKAMYVAKGYATPVVEAALAAGFDDLAAFDLRLAALAEFSKSEGFEQAVLTFKRAANIIRKQGAEAGVELTGAYDAALFEHDAERALAAALDSARPRFQTSWAGGDFPALMGLLAELRPAVDGFFDNVMVMAEAPAVRANRLNLLQALTEMLGRLADFTALQV